MSEARIAVDDPLALPCCCELKEEIACACDHRGPVEELLIHAEYPEHRYCPKCGSAFDWTFV